MYVVNDWPHLFKLGSCGFDSVTNIRPPHSSGRPICAEQDGQLVFCNGLICSKFDPKVRDLRNMILCQEIFLESYGCEMQATIRVD